MFGICLNNYPHLHYPERFQQSVEKVGTQDEGAQMEILAMAALSSFNLLQDIFPQRMRIGTTDLARVLDMHPMSIRNAIHKRAFAIPTYLDGRHRYADLRDVAEYLDKKRNANGKTLGRPTKAVKLRA